LLTADTSIRVGNVFSAEFATSCKNIIWFKYLKSGVFIADYAVIHIMITTLQQEVHERCIKRSTYVSRTHFIQKWGGGGGLKARK
jgi:ATP-dependent Clp protease ATP-binding subunit ClpA